LNSENAQSRPQPARSDVVRNRDAGLGYVKKERGKTKHFGNPVSAGPGASPGLDEPGFLNISGCIQQCFTLTPLGSARARPVTASKVSYSHPEVNHACLTARAMPVAAKLPSPAPVSGAAQLGSWRHGKICRARRAPAGSSTPSRSVVEEAAVRPASARRRAESRNPNPRFAEVLLNGTPDSPPGDTLCLDFHLLSLEFFCLPSPSFRLLSTR